MKKLVYVLPLVVVLLVLLACDATTSVQGRVYGPDGQPLSGASVQLVDEKGEKIAERFSQNDGSYLVIRTHAPFHGPIHLEVYKMGYLTFQRPVTLKHQNNIDVSLKYSMR